MTVSNKLATGRILELLDSLKNAVQDFAARTDKLNEDFRTRTAKERLRCEAALDEHNRQLSAAIAETDLAFQAAKHAAERKYEHRKARIGRAYQVSKEQKLKEVDKTIDTRKYELQKRMLQADKDREAGLAKTAATFEP